MFQVLELYGEFVGGHDFVFIVTEVCLILTDLFPCNWSPRAADEKIRERAKFEQFKSAGCTDF